MGGRGLMDKTSASTKIPKTLKRVWRQSEVCHSPGRRGRRQPAPNDQCSSELTGTDIGVI